MIPAAFFEGRLCESNVSYEFFPRETIRIPLDKIGPELEKQGIYCGIKTPYVITCKMGGVSVSIYPSAKILVKNVNVEKDAREVFHSVLDALNQCPALPSFSTKKKK